MSLSEHAKFIMFLIVSTTLLQLVNCEFHPLEYPIVVNGQIVGHRLPKFRVADFLAKFLDTVTCGHPSVNTKSPYCFAMAHITEQMIALRKIRRRVAITQGRSSNNLHNF